MIGRAGEVAWVTDHLAEIESDLSAIHRYRVDSTADGGWECGAGEWDGLSSRRFFLLVERLPAYPGVLQAILVNAERERQEREHGTPITDDTIRSRTSAAVPETVGGIKVVPLTREMVATGAGHLEGLDGLIEVRRAPAA
jgi:hypothetical protein